MSALFWAAYCLILASFLANLGFLVFEARHIIRRDPRRALLQMLGGGLALGIAIRLARDTAIRGIYDNEHDFEFLSRGYFSVLMGAQPLTSIFQEKEVSPLVFFSTIDLLSNFYLPAIILGQIAAWGCSAALLFGAVKRIGGSSSAAALSAALLSFNFHSFLNTFSVGTTNAIVFYILCSVYALVSIERGQRYLYWFFCASFLVFTARFEAFPPLLLGLFFARRLIPDPRQAKRWGAIFFFCCLLWSIGLSRIAEAAHDTQPRILRNLKYHLGQENLGRIFDVPDAWILSGVVVLILILMALNFRRRLARPLLFTAVLSVSWLAYFSTIFIPVPLYPLQFSRHHLVFFIPFCLLFGAIASAAPRAGKAAGFASALGILVYFFLNQNLTANLDFQKRTNDYEWQFLFAARRQWPKGCTVDASPARLPLLQKYFPSEPLGDKPCHLTYLSPRDQIFGFFSSRETAPALELSRTTPWIEWRFSHRFYTDWIGPWNKYRYEIPAAVPVSVGFFRDNSAKIPKKQTPAGPAFSQAPWSESRLFAKSGTPEIHRCARLETAADHGDIFSPSAASRGGLSPRILACFDRALETCSKDCPNTLACRAGIREALGDKKGAIDDLTASLALAEPAWERRAFVSLQLERLKRPPAFQQAR